MRLDNKENTNIYKNGHDNKIKIPCYGTKINLITSNIHTLITYFCNISKNTGHENVPIFNKTHHIKTTQES